MSSAKGKAMSERRLALRKKLWPTVTDDDLWLRSTRQGFATVPRALPLISMIMDGMNKGSPVSSVYTDLWCRTHDEMFVQLQSPIGLAFSAGFEGERAARTWKDRMRKLMDLGFIDIKPGQYGDMSFALIFNPYHVIRRHYEAKHPAVNDQRYNALLARADEIGADDPEDELPDDWRIRPPPAPVAKEAAKEEPTKMSLTDPTKPNVRRIKSTK